VTGTHDESDDAALLRAHVAGDRDAFAELVRRHRDRLWALALRTLGDREEAADAVQDALVSAYRSADRFRGDAAVTTWLHRIVVNACLDRVRRRQARPTVPLPEHEVGLVAVRGGVMPYDSDTVLTVRAALAQLPTEQRVALVLLDMQGYSVSEIARMLDVAEGTIKSRCARGRARLAVLLGHLRRDAGDSRHPEAEQGNRPAADDVRGSGASGTDQVGASDTDHVGGVW
jgi:RNA polymerase sigma-70 factor (ECF subfamily)